MIVLPGVRSPGAKAEGASASGRTAPTSGLRRPSLNRVPRSASRARSGSTTKKTARPSLGGTLGGTTMLTSEPPARTSAAERSRIATQFVQAQADHVGQDPEIRDGDLRARPPGNSRGRVQCDRRPHHVGGRGGETAVEHELTCVVGSIDLEALLHVGKRRQEAGVMKHGGEVEKFRVGLQAESASVNDAEDEYAPGVMVDEGAGHLLHEAGGFGDRLRFRDLDPGDHLAHDLCAFRYQCATHGRCVATEVLGSRAQAVGPSPLQPARPAPQMGHRDPEQWRPNPRGLALDGAQVDQGHGGPLRPPDSGR